jgi:hypothetical protein
MAKSTEVTSIDSGIVTKSNYRGNVQSIPVTITAGTNGTYDVTKVLPQEARVISASLFYGDFGTDFGIDLGYSGSATAIATVADTNDAAGELAFPTTGSTAGSLDVGGKVLQVVIAGADNTANIVGNILIATNE